MEFETSRHIKESAISLEWIKFQFLISSNQAGTTVLLIE